MDAADDWKRLAEYAVARRRQLGMSTRNALADATGLSYRLLGDLERGDRGVSERTLDLLEDGLDWMPGSARAVLQGGEPVLAENPRHIGESSPGATSASWMRALGEAYGIAAELTESGKGRQGGQLTRALNEIGRSLTAYSTVVHTAYSIGDCAMAVTERPIRSAPTVLGIALGQYMRRLREGNLLTSEKVGQITGFSTTDIQLLELGRAALDGNEIHLLLTVYGIDDPQVLAECVNLADEATQSGWWTGYNDILPEWFRSYVSLERCAQQIRTYESEFVPGLLQTADYASAVMKARSGPDRERKVQLRMERQQILEEPDNVQLWAVIDESALTGESQAIGHEVMRDQITHLMEMNIRSNVIIQIMPQHVRAPLNSFSILRFHETEIPDIAYTEQAASALYLDRSDDVKPYRERMEYMTAKAYDARESAELLMRIRKKINSRIPDNKTRQRAPI